MKALTTLSQRLPEWLLLGVLFVMPLLWLPWTPEALEFNKQALLLLAAIGILATWFFKSIRQESIEFSLAPSILASILAATAAFFAFLFSQDRYRSLIGFGNGSVDSFASIGAAIILGFAAAAIFTTASSRRRGLWVFALSGTVTSLVAVLAAFGWLGHIFSALGLGNSPASGFNTIGSLSSLTVFLDVTLLVSVALAATAKKLLPKILSVVFSLLILATLVVVSMPFGWWLLAFGSLVLFLFLLLQSPAEAVSASIIRPPLIFAFALAMAIIHPRLLGNLVNLPLEIAPTQTTTVEIAQKTLLEDNRLLFGSGPGTWVFDYTKHRPQSINRTAFWSLRFLQGSAAVPTDAATQGALGLSAWLLVAVALLGAVATQAFKVFRTRREIQESGEPREEDFPAVGALVITLIASQFLASSNITFLTYFWVGAAMLAACQNTFRLAVPKGSVRAAMSSMLAMFAVVGFLVTVYFVGVRYAAALDFVNGLQKANSGDTEAGLSYFQRATNLDSGNDLYARTLSQAALLRLTATPTQGQKTLTQDDVKTLAALTVSEARRATTISPQFVENWSQLASVESTFIALGRAEDVSKVVESTADSWQHAIHLEPASPFLYLQEGIAYLTAADKIANLGKDREAEHTAYLTTARSLLEQSRNLKNDYTPTLFQLSMLDVREGKTKQAIERLEDTKRLAPQDINVLFQLGVLYYNSGQLDKAKDVLDEALKIQIDQKQDFANARYLLGLIADQQGRRDEAIQQFQKIKDLNPDNQIIDQILKNLRSGKHALDGIQNQGPGVPPPPTEKPRTQPKEPGL